MTRLPAVSKALPICPIVPKISPSITAYSGGARHVPGEQCSSVPMLPKRPPMVVRTVVLPVVTALVLLPLIRKGKKKTSESCTSRSQCCLAPNGGGSSRCRLVRDPAFKAPMPDVECQVHQNSNQKRKCPLCCKLAHGCVCFVRTSSKSRFEKTESVLILHLTKNCRNPNSRPCPRSASQHLSHSLCLC